MGAVLLKGWLDDLNLREIKQLRKDYFNLGEFRIYELFPEEINALIEAKRKQELTSRRISIAYIRIDALRFPKFMKNALKRIAFNKIKQYNWERIRIYL